MATQQKSNVGVVLVNNFGFYSAEYFRPLQLVWGRREDLSFLITNVQYFRNTRTNVTPPAQPFDRDWRPPEFGKPLMLIADKAVPDDLAKMYLETYSLDGKFGKLVGPGYLCAPDIDKICHYMTSPNKNVQRLAMQMMQRDKTVIDLACTALEIQNDIQDKKTREDTTQAIFYTLTNGLRDAPLDHKFTLPAVLTDRKTRQNYARANGQSIAEVTKNALLQVQNESNNLPKAPHTPQSQSFEPSTRSNVARTATDGQSPIFEDVVHVTTPHDYFGTEIKNHPIFGVQDYAKLGFKPVPTAGLDKPVIYMPEQMQTDHSGKMLKSYLTRDQWERLRYSQLTMAGKFEDTLKFREEEEKKSGNGKTTDRTLLLGLQYFMLGMLCYSNFNFLIDFNELNRISQKPTDEALRDLYILNACAMQNLNWVITKNSNLNTTCPTLAKEQFFKALNLKNPPEYTPKIGNDYLLRYTYLRDEVLHNQSRTPWAYEPFETDLTANSLKNEFAEMQNSCNQPSQTR